MTVADAGCRHVDDCDGCAHLFLTCQVEGCWSADVTVRWVAIGRGRTVRVMLCDAHGAMEPKRATPFTRST